jgi:hypothetical protein
MTKKEVTMKAQIIDQYAEETQACIGRTSNAGALLPSRSASRTAAVFGCMLLATSFLCLDKNATAQQSSTMAASRTAAQKGMSAEIPLQLAKSMDSKKLKAGDEVDGKTATILHLSDGTLVSRGTKVVGHVTQAKARSSGDAESALGIVFDKISLPNGMELAITSVIQAVAPNPNAGVDTGGSISGGGLNEMTEKSTMSQSAQPSAPLLNDRSVGVLGIKNLRLGADGVLSSDQKAVKLDSGTQILVQAQIIGS